MLFNFELLPLEKVVPWGGPGTKSLHWFGLTDGRYWIEVGDQKLFEYSAAARRQGAPDFCEYQVARLYEDVIQMVPHVLDPVPADLCDLLEPEHDTTWAEARDAWLDHCGDHLHDDSIWDIATAGTEWLRVRMLTTIGLQDGYSANIWSDDRNVYIVWANQKANWSATRGMFHISRDQFISEVVSFHSRLMSEMETRIGLVQNGALSPEIQVDLAGLQREHLLRAHGIDKLFAPSAHTEDWATVREAVHQIKRRATTTLKPDGAASFES